MWFLPTAAIFLLPMASLTSAQDVCSAENATIFAIEWAVPLLAFEKYWHGPQNNPTPTVNVVRTPTGISSPQRTVVRRPSVDALLASITYDISQDDLQVTVPAVDDRRYYSISFYDLFGDNYYTLGSLSQSSPGNYLLTLNSSAVSSDNQTSNPNYQDIIYAPSTFGTVVCRVMLRNSTTDVEVVQGIEAQWLSTPVPRQGSASGPPLTLAMFANSSSGPAEHLMQLASRFSQAFANGSPDTLVASTKDQLSLAGVNDGNYTRPDCVNLTHDYEIVQAAMSGYLRQPGRTLDMGNNWTLVNSPDEHHFVDTVEGLAWISNFGYLPLMPQEALYPLLGFTPRLESGEAFLLKFSGRPPVRQDGFWSVTMYSSDGYLVDNPIDRYLISDRNELSYPNGTLVYSSGGQAFSAPVTAIEDDPFQILIQADAPPHNWTSNWLPSPQEPGNFTVALRWYGPTERLKDHSYIYPLLEKVAAVSAQTNSTGAPSSTSSASAGQSGATSTPNSASTTAIFAISNLGTAVLQLAILVSSIVFYQTFA